MMYTQKLLSLALLFLLLPGPSAAEPQSRPLRLDLQVEVADVRGDRALAPGAQVREGDRLAVLISVDQTAYVYLAHVTGTEVRQLFPTGPVNPVEPGAPFRIPRPGRRFVHDATQGAERLVAYASKKPLTPEALKAHLKAMGDAMRARARLLAREGGKARAAPPERLTSETRSLREVDEDIEGLCAERSWVVVSCFPFLATAAERR